MFIFNLFGNMIKKYFSIFFLTLVFSIPFFSFASTYPVQQVLTNYNNSGGGNFSVLCNSYGGTTMKVVQPFYLTSTSTISNIEFLTAGSVATSTDYYLKIYII